MSSINLKPNKPDTFDGKRDYLAVNTWVYKVEQYLCLTQLSSPDVTITDQNRIQFASSYLTGSAAVWWFNIVNTAAVPGTWEDFKTILSREFIPTDHTRRARDSLRKLKQTGSVEKFLTEFRNTILMVTDINEGEKVDRFINGLKYGVKIEVLKSGCNSFEECVRIALNVDSAIWGAKKASFDSSTFSSTPSFQNNNPTPMEIGNLRGTTPSTSHREQRRKDLQQGACFRCHKAGCRPWKCGQAKVNHTEVHSGTQEETIATPSKN